MFIQKMLMSWQFREKYARNFRTKLIESFESNFIFQIQLLVS
jgi:hypothetical protein